MRRLVWMALLAALLAGAFVGVHRISSHHLSDPDRIYHFALSRQMAESGRLYLLTVPQVEGLGWHNYFPDKEFLFHQITALGYRLAGDQGVVFSALACALMALLVFFFHGARSLPLPAVFFATLVIFAAPAFFFRMQMVRPHVAAVLFFVILNAGLLRRSPWMAAAGAGFFALAYHAFYIPLFCLGAAALAALTLAGDGRRHLLNAAGAGLAALAVGLVVNPYFPSNVISAVEIARIPSLMHGELSYAQFGNELYPVPSNIYLKLFWLPLLLCLAGLIFSGRALARREEGKPADWRWFYLVPLTVLFAGLCLQSRRAGEYLFPISGFLLLLLLEQVKRWNGKTYGALAAGLAVFALVVGKEQLDAIAAPPRPWIVENKKAVLAIPEQEGAKVYNCEWDKSPYLLYYRPELRFIDIMDPSLLYFHRPDIFVSRESLRLGKVPDAHGLIQKAFAADFVFCENPEIVKQLERDPGFQRLYPPAGVSRESGQVVPSVFSVRKSAASAYVRKFVVNRLPGATVENFSDLGPGAAAEEAREEELEKTSYLNLSSLWQEPPLPPGAAYCAMVRPHTDEMKRSQGAQFAVLGGGRSLRLWLNGAPLYASRGGFLRAENSQVVVRLPRALRSEDKLELQVCSAADAPFWGVALSLWSGKDFSERCRWKKGGLRPLAGSLDWRHLGQESETCLGPLAAPVASQEIRPVPGTK